MAFIIAKMIIVSARIFAATHSNVRHYCCKCGLMIFRWESAFAFITTNNEWQSTKWTHRQKKNEIVTTMNSDIWFVVISIIQSFIRPFVYLLSKLCFFFLLQFRFCYTYIIDIQWEFAAKTFHLTVFWGGKNVHLASVVSIVTSPDEFEWIAAHSAAVQNLHQINCNKHWTSFSVR